MPTKRLSIALVAGLLTSSSIYAQDPCETALQSPDDVLELSPSSSVTASGTVPEWDSDILKIRAQRAGLLTLDVEGMEAEVSLQTAGNSGLQMVNSAPAEPGAAIHTPVVPSAVYCLRLAPSEGSGSLTVHLRMTDLCHLSPHADDHGDSFACATELASGASLPGALTPGDRDVFAFSLASGGSVDIQGSGGVTLSGKLFDAAGTLLAADDPGAGGFAISEALSAGRYFVRVEGPRNASGSYTISLEPAP
ncbi:MAG: PPC domain-containing protein [Acidobacteriota bacterium]